MGWVEGALLVGSSDSDLLSNRACGAARNFMTDSDTRGPTYSESGGCHSGTLEEIEKSKMASKMGEKRENCHNVISNQLTDILLAPRYMFWHPINMIEYIFVAYNAWKYKMASNMAANSAGNYKLFISSLLVDLEAHFFCLGICLGNHQHDRLHLYA